MSCCPPGGPGDRGSSWYRREDTGRKLSCRPIFSRILSLYTEQNDLQFAVPGGLIGTALTGVVRRGGPIGTAQTGMVRRGGPVGTARTGVVRHGEESSVRPRPGWLDTGRSHRYGSDRGG